MADLLSTQQKKVKPLTLNDVGGGNQALPPKEPLKFRDDVNADKDRESNEKIAGFKAVGDALKQSVAPQPKQTTDTPPAFQAFRETLRQQDPAFKALQSQTFQTLAKPAEGLSDIERSKTLSDTSRLLQELGAERKQELVGDFGAGTGQVQTGLDDFARGAQRTIGDVGSDLAVRSEEIRRGQEAQKLAGSLQLLNLASQENLAKANMSLQERMQSNAQQFEATQANLNRELSKFEQATQISANQAMQLADQTFQTGLQQQGYLNSKDLEQMRAGIEENFLRMGFDQETATQLAGFKHDLIKQQNEQAFMEQMDALDKSWMSGERVEAQAFEKAITTLKQDFAAGENELDRILNLEIAENEIAFRTAAQAASEAHDLAMSQEGFTQQQALEASRQVFEEQMQAAGFSQDQILQAERIQGDLTAQQRDIDSRKAMLAVQMAQENEQFRANLGLDERQLSLNEETARAETELALKNFGLAEKELNAVLDSKETQDALGALSMAMEMLPDNDEALQPFTERLFQQIGAASGMDQAQIDAAIESSRSDEQPGQQLFTSSNAVKIAEDVASGDLTKEAAKTQFQNLTSEEWQAVASDPDSLAKLKKAGIFTPVSKNTQFLRKKDFNKSGLVADKVEVSDESGQLVTSKTSAGEGQGSIVIYNGQPYRVTRYQSKLGADTLSNKRVGRMYAVSLTNPDEGEVKISDTGWRDI
jgi:hypothetical protein